jgi:hypothetical protein
MAKKALTEAQEIRRKAVVEKARAAAKAAGKDWKMLSPEERKTFRVQARKELK